MRSGPPGKNKTKKKNPKKYCSQQTLFCRKGDFRKQKKLKKGHYTLKLFTFYISSNRCFQNYDCTYMRLKETKASIRHQRQLYFGGLSDQGHTSRRQLVNFTPSSTLFPQNTSKGQYVHGFMLQILFFHA